MAFLLISIKHFIWQKRWTKMLCDKIGRSEFISRLVDEMWRTRYMSCELLNICLAYCLINSSFQAFYCIFVYVFIFCSKIEIALFTQKAYCIYSRITANILGVYRLDSGVSSNFVLPCQLLRSANAKLALSVDSPSK